MESAMNLISKSFLILSMSQALLAGEDAVFWEDQIPSFRAPAGKALCVVIRPTGWNALMQGKLDQNADIAELWLDKRIVGATKPNSITSFEVPPGEHLVFTYVDVVRKRVQLNVQAGRIYYIFQTVTPRFNTFTLMSCEEAKQKIEEEKGKIRYETWNPGFTRLRDMRDDIYQKELTRWKKWAAENPKKAKAEKEYAGCAAIP
jgi:hypothetical protein